MRPTLQNLLCNWVSSICTYFAVDIVHRAELHHGNRFAVCDWWLEVARESRTSTFILDRRDGCAKYLEPPEERIDIGRLRRELGMLGDR